MRKGAVIAALVAAAAAGALFLGLRPEPGSAGGKPRASPGGKPIDAAQITAGTLPFKVMPPEVTSALEMHTNEIVRTAELVETKQARITGVCAPGSAIRLVGQDGSVVCQRLPKGVVSVAAIAAFPRHSTTGTAQGAVAGGVGRFQTSGPDDFLVTGIQLPDGATVTGFSYTYFDADDRADGGAYLYRSDDSVIAGVATQDSANAIRVAETNAVADGRVDNSKYAYFVYFEVSAEANSNLIPIAASVTYRLP